VQIIVVKCTQLPVQIIVVKCTQLPVQIIVIKCTQLPVQIIVKCTPTTCTNMSTRLHSLFRLYRQHGLWSLSIDWRATFCNFLWQSTHQYTRNMTSFPPDSNLLSQHKSLPTSLAKLYTRMHKRFCYGNDGQPLNRGPVWHEWSGEVPQSFIKT